MFRLFFKRDNPDNFRFKVVEGWISEDYVEFRYSTTKGHFWNSIKTVKESTFLFSISTDDKVYETENLTKSLGNGNFDYEKSQWDSIEKIDEYHKGIYEKVKSSNQWLKDRRDEKKRKRKNAWKKVNKK
jgi:hypothetical protein